MPYKAVFKEKFAFKDLPPDWKPHNVGVDWRGEPLLLIQEGKPPAPQRTGSPDTFDAHVAWLNTPPKAHHVLSFENAKPNSTTFTDSTGLFTYHIQRFGEGWLLGESRGGNTGIYDIRGRLLRTLDLGDASVDLQTTTEGHIWVSYFDEGVYGGGIGSAGLVCFDANGKAVFEYADFAAKNNLPYIDDCYALNVVDDQEIWVSYYSDFPLVQLRNFQLKKNCEKFAAIDRGFCLRGRSVIYKKAYTRNEQADQVLLRSLDGQQDPVPLMIVDSEGHSITGHFAVAARGANLYLQTAEALYGMVSVELPPEAE